VYSTTRNAIWTREDRERTKRANPQWWAAHLEQRRTRAKSDRLKDPRKNIWFAARGRARKRGLSFTITVDDIVIPEFCPALGLRLTIGSGKLCDSSPSLDRLVPERGYVAGNVAVISHKANRIKNNATTAELIKLAAWLQLESPKV
jgi:hypothetical protein